VTVIKISIINTAVPFRLYR